MQWLYGRGREQAQRRESGSSNGSGNDGPSSKRRACCGVSNPVTDKGEKAVRGVESVGGREAHLPLKGGLREKDGE